LFVRTRSPAGLRKYAIILSNFPTPNIASARLKSGSAWNAGRPPGCRRHLADRLEHRPSAVDSRRRALRASEQRVPVSGFVRSLDADHGSRKLNSRGNLLGMRFLYRTGSDAVIFYTG